jgi:hypothetical protein
MHPCDWSSLSVCTPDEQLLAQYGRDFWTVQELFEDSYRPREVVLYSNANLEIVLEDTHEPHVSSPDIRGAKERFTGIEGCIKLASRYLQLETF